MVMVEKPPMSEPFGAQKRHQEQNEQGRGDQRAEREIKAHRRSHFRQRADDDADQRKRADQKQGCKEIGH
jgi:hypothetical protein